MRLFQVVDCARMVPILDAEIGPGDQDCLRERACLLLGYIRSILRASTPTAGKSETARYLVIQWAGRLALKIRGLNSSIQTAIYRSTHFQNFKTKIYASVENSVTQRR